MIILLFALVRRLGVLHRRLSPQRSHLSRTPAHQSLTFADSQLINLGDGLMNRGGLIREGCEWVACIPRSVGSRIHASRFPEQISFFVAFRRIMIGPDLLERVVVPHIPLFLSKLCIGRCDPISVGYLSILRASCSRSRHE